MSVGSELVLKTSNLPVAVNDGSLCSYLEQIRRFPVLSEEEEERLVVDFQQNKNMQAAQKLVTSHLRLAAKIAFNYRHYGLPMSDIISEANIGLMQAVKKFDLSKKVRLATYAIWWIKASVNDYILRSWSLVKIGTRAAQKKLFYNLNRIKARLGIYENRELNPEEVKTIAGELVVEESEVLEMNGRLHGDRSLNVSVSDEDDNEKIDLVVDGSQNIEETVSRRQEASLKAKILQECMLRLDEREQYIVKNRMLSENIETLEDIGQRFGISRERVRQIEKIAFEKLKNLVLLEIKEKTC